MLRRKCLRKMAEEDGGSEEVRGVLFNLRTAAMFVPEEDGAVLEGAGVLGYDVSKGFPA